MPDIIDQQVIDFTINWCQDPTITVDLTTTLKEIGAMGDSCKTYIMELEDHFGLTYVDGDEKGINTVGDAANLIKRKLADSGSNTGTV